MIDCDARAHGRLGTGDNRCRHAPVRLKSWPPGFPGCVVQAVALGGAHSVLVANRAVPATLANPWGVESVAYAWGYGFGGQLGLGEQVRAVCVRVYGTAIVVVYWRPLGGEGRCCSLSVVLC